MASITGHTAASASRRSTRGKSNTMPSTVYPGISYEPYDRRVTAGKSNVFTCYEAKCNRPGIDIRTCCKCDHYEMDKIHVASVRRTANQDTAGVAYQCDTLWKSVPKAVSSVSTPLATSPVVAIAQKQPPPIDSAGGKRKQLSSDELL